MSLKMTGLEFINLICGRLGVTSQGIFAIKISAEVNGGVEVDIMARGESDVCAVAIESAVSDNVSITRVIADPQTILVLKMDGLRQKEDRKYFREEWKRIHPNSPEIVILPTTASLEAIHVSQLSADELRRLRELIRSDSEPAIEAPVIVGADDAGVILAELDAPEATEKPPCKT